MFLIPPVILPLLPQQYFFYSYESIQANRFFRYSQPPRFERLDKSSDSTYRLQNPPEMAVSTFILDALENETNTLDDWKTLG